MTTDMTVAIENLLAAIKDDYAAGNRSDNLIERFRWSLSFKEGKKYIKIISNNSVWGFVVNTGADNIFRYGDILKAAGWATPARNKSRGNVFEDYSVKWTGPYYL